MTDESMVLKGEERQAEVAQFNPTQAREVAEVQSAMVIAKRFPRDEKAALDRILNACSREGLAAASRYQYARAGTDITGPSIRLAEALAQNWGNIDFGIRELEQRNGESVVEAFCWDKETNTRASKVFAVPHVRYTRKAGTVKLEDPRDVYEVSANQGARRLRAAILAIIPGDITEAALKQCDTTLTAKVKLTPERIKLMLKSFAEVGVSKAQVEKKIQRRVDTITPAQFVNLGNIYNSIKDEMSKPEDWFESEAKPEPEAKASGKQTLEQALGKPKAESVPPPVENPLDQPIGGPQEDLL
jgi:hypothetical protein